jgi:hypothetical protein
MVLVAFALLMAACGVQAQEVLPQVVPQPPVQEPSVTAPEQQPPAAEPPVAPAAPIAALPAKSEPAPQPMPADKLQRIYLIRQYETVLTNAVRTGATSLANMLKLADPTSLFVTGSARARGFQLEDYGVVFDVDVPTMMQSVLWSAQMLQRQQEVDKMHEIIDDPRTTDGIRRVAQSELRRLERMVTNPQPIPAIPAGPLALAPQGFAVAQTTDSVAAAPPLPDPRTADEMYTDVIKNALIDAMLSFGPALRLGDDEWLTIAARAATPAVPNQMDDSSSILIRIKVAELTALLTGRLTRDAVLKKNELKEG